ncbi:hypothetical protein PBAL39_16299 [Pedobacter sp. BAL39]|uniref:hypothetical protein n=1 Tax=Pedobacter sp. BAL39 TaxID=391596 RepID=UPI00015594E1|nr:hypothetical protein [Pedobacter sp. BAL39]EDM38003.1 hypothetical protein PBAL39_16299 [Pedobacter sp. BAL39]
MKGAAVQLAKWVALKHQHQLIKKTNEPYFNHLLAVARMSAPFEEYGYEIGLCHDLLEDTNTGSAELLDQLLSFGYSGQEARLITTSVVELTDVYTPSNYPELRKKERKARESARLAAISASAQTVKYADLIYNLHWMLKHDRKHVKKYLKKKRLLLNSLNKGNEQLRKKAYDDIELGFDTIK